MVTEGELRRLAGAWRTDVTVVERDYVLSWVLAGLYRRAALAERLVFKGGTALRKCYFPDYRFSADLDFTLRSALPGQELRSEVEVACSSAAQESGLRLAIVDFRTLRDAAGEEAYQARAEYTGPLGRLGIDQPRIRLDLTVYEKLVLPPQDRAVHHPYSDAEALNLSCAIYPLEEMLAEKLRAMLRRSRARDLYDVWQLMTRYAETLDLGLAIRVLAEKARYKGFSFSDVDDFLTSENRDAWSRAWEGSLRRQVAVVADCNQVIAEVESVLSGLLGSRDS
jgi:predicted nucleotidyltransferase component of viral defense system